MEHRSPQAPRRNTNSTLGAALLLIVSVGNVFGQLAASSASGMPFALFVALRVAPHAVLVAAAVGLLYEGRGCLGLALVALVTTLVVDGGLLLLGHSSGIGPATLLSVVLLLILGRGARRPVR